MNNLAARADMAVRYVRWGPEIGGLVHEESFHFVMDARAEVGRRREGVYGALPDNTRSQREYKDKVMRKADELMRFR